MNHPTTTVGRGATATPASWTTDKLDDKLLVHN